MLLWNFGNICEEHKLKG